MKGLFLLLFIFITSLALECFVSNIYRPFVNETLQVNKINTTAILEKCAISFKFKNVTVCEISSIQLGIMTEDKESLGYIPITIPSPIETTEMNESTNATVSSFEIASLSSATSIGTSSSDNTSSVTSTVMGIEAIIGTIQSSSTEFSTISSTTENATIILENSSTLFAQKNNSNSSIASPVSSTTASSTSSSTPPSTTITINTTIGINIAANSAIHPDPEGLSNPTIPIIYICDKNDCNTLTSHFKNWTEKSKHMPKFKCVIDALDLIRALKEREEQQRTTAIENSVQNLTGTTRKPHQNRRTTTVQTSIQFMEEWPSLVELKSFFDIRYVFLIMLAAVLAIVGVWKFSKWIRLKAGGVDEEPLFY